MKLFFSFKLSLEKVIEFFAFVERYFVTRVLQLFFVLGVLLLTGKFLFFSFGAETNPLPHALIKSNEEGKWELNIYMQTSKTNREESMRGQGIKDHRDIKGPEARVGEVTRPFPL